MTDPATFYKRTYQALLRLKVQQAGYSSNAVPPSLLAQLKAHEQAVFLTRQRLDSLISADEWWTAVTALNLNEPSAVELPEPAPLPSPPPVTSSTYHLVHIRELLTKGFSDTDLRTFCFDQPEFREVYDQLAHNSGKEQIVSLILEHADQNLLFEPLLTWAKIRNPVRYRRHQPYVVK
jgi:hypothetical protein